MSIEPFGATQPWQVCSQTVSRSYTYDRRGRRESGDTQPYAVAREINDPAGLIDDEACPPAGLYGDCSGGTLMLEAALALGGQVKKIVM